MRSYPRNSPQAAARILAMAMLADGHLSKDELDALDSTRAREQLGMDRLEWHDIVHGLCEDLISTASQNWSGICLLDEPGVAALLDEIDDKGLQEKIAALCVALTDADEHIAEGESVMLAAIARHWGFATAPA